MNKKSILLAILLVGLLAVKQFGFISLVHTTESNFGYETIGGTPNMAGGNKKIACRFQITESGEALSISWYGKSDGATNAKACVYSDNSGAPNALLGVSNEVAITATYTWWNFTLGSINFTVNTYYWLTVHFSSAYYWWYDLGSTNQFAFSIDTYSDGPSDPFGTPSFYDEEKMSIYCTYTVDTPPTYSNVGTNTTLAGQPCQFQTLWNDNINVTGFIFGTNNTGVWTNDTWVSFTVFYNTTAAWSNVTKTLNGTNHAAVQWEVWANDTSNGWNNTGTQFLTVIGISGSPFRFGWEGIGVAPSSILANNYIVGTNFTFVDNVESQTDLISITFAYTQYSGSSKIKYALYNSTLNLMASTQEYSGTLGVRTLNFTSPPELTNNTVYWLVAWGQFWWYYYEARAPLTRKSFNMTSTYTGDFPDSLAPASYTNSTWAIYGTFLTDEELMDFYPTSALYDGGGIITLHPSSNAYDSAYGQTFKVIKGDFNLTKVQFYMYAENSPIGTDAKAVLYETTGTYGSNSKPTGDPLVTSADFDILNVGGYETLITLQFPNIVTLKNGTVYAIVFQGPTAGIINTTNYLDTGFGLLGHDGDAFTYTNGDWYFRYGSPPTVDWIFYVYGTWLYKLNLRTLDANSNVLSGAEVHVDLGYKLSDINGWTNWTSVGDVANISVNHQDIWVNGTFTVTMDENKTIDVICNVYSLTVYLQTHPDSPTPNIPITGASLTLTRDDGVNITTLNGLYGLPENPVTNAYNSSHARYVWTQLANQSSSYIVWADITGSGGAKSVTTSLTANTEKVIQLVYPVSGPSYPSGPVFPEPSPFIPAIKPLPGFYEIFGQKNTLIAAGLIAGVSLIFAIPLVGRKERKKNGFKRYAESNQNKYKRKKKRKK